MKLKDLLYNGRKTFVLEITPAEGVTEMPDFIEKAENVGLEAGIDYVKADEFLYLTPYNGDLDKMTTIINEYILNGVLKHYVVRETKTEYQNSGNQRNGKYDFFSELNEVLKDAGVIFLTGEACGLGLRKLFDLTPEGRAHVENFFGLQTVEGSNWNSRQGQTASVMLTWQNARDLATFILATEYQLVAEVDGRWYCFSDEKNYYDLFAEELQKKAENSHARMTIVRNKGIASQSLRNTHAMTGRTV